MDTRQISRVKPFLHICAITLIVITAAAGFSLLMHPLFTLERFGVSGVIVSILGTSAISVAILVTYFAFSATAPQLFAQQLSPQEDND